MKEALGAKPQPQEEFPSLRTTPGRVTKPRRSYFFPPWSPVRPHHPGLSTGPGLPPDAAPPLSPV